MRSEIERFGAELAKNEALRKELQSGGLDAEQVVKFANSYGYQFDLEEVRSTMQQDGELNENQLQSVTGGVGGPGPITIAGNPDTGTCICSGNGWSFVSF